MSEIVKPGGITLNGFLAAEITVVAITSSFVALRLIANLRLQNRLMVDDCKIENSQDHSPIF